MAIESASALESQTATPSNIELANIESSKKQNDVDPYLVTFREPFDEDNPKYVNACDMQHATCNIGVACR